MNWNETLNRKVTRRTFLGTAGAGTTYLLLKAATRSGDFQLPKESDAATVDAVDSASKQMLTEKDFTKSFDDLFYESKSFAEPIFSIGLSEGEARSTRNDVILLKGKADINFNDDKFNIIEEGQILSTYRAVIVTPSRKGDYSMYPHSEKGQTVYYFVEGQMPKYTDTQKNAKTGREEVIVKDLSPNDLLRLNYALGLDFPSKAIVNSKKA